MRKTDKDRIDYIIAEAKQSQQGNGTRTFWTDWLISRAAIDAAIKARGIK